jgi:hypothetical protein
MTVFKILIFSIFLFVVTICRGQKNTHEQEKIDGRIADSIAGLPEVIAADNVAKNSLREKDTW